MSIWQEADDLDTPEAYVSISDGARTHCARVADLILPVGADETTICDAAAEDYAEGYVGRKISVEVTLYRNNEVIDCVYRMVSPS